MRARYRDSLSLDPVARRALPTFQAARPPAVRAVVEAAAGLAVTTAAVRALRARGAARQAGDAGAEARHPVEHDPAASPGGAGGGRRRGIADRRARPPVERARHADLPHRAGAREARAGQVGIGVAAPRGGATLEAVEGRPEVRPHRQAGPRPGVADLAGRSGVGAVGGLAVTLEDRGCRACRVERTIGVTAARKEAVGVPWAPDAFGGTTTDSGK